MSNRNGVILSIVAILIIGIYFFIAYMREFLPKYRWYETYNYTDENPYGLKHTYDLFKAGMKDSSFILIDKKPSEILNKNAKNSSYIFIGANWIMDSLSVERLCDFVRKGNYAFISSYNSPKEIVKKKFYDKPEIPSYKGFMDSSVNTRFLDPQGKEYSKSFFFYFQVLKKKSLHYWLHTDLEKLADSLDIHGIEPVSVINNNFVNCYKFPYGRGVFIFHTTPLMLTNYHVVRQEGFDYMNELFSTMKKENIYWDEYSKAPHFLWQQNGRADESPLRFILSQKSLRWAWYLSLIAIILYLVFNSKREQQLIPLMPENKNTSVEFVKAVGMLHYQLKAHSVLADEILKLFLAYNKNKYGISPQLERELLITEITKRSGVAELLVRDIFKKHLAVRYNPAPEPVDLINLHSLTELFYKKSN